jgi:transposase
VPKSNGSKKQEVAAGTKRKNLTHGTNSAQFLFVEEMAAFLNKLGLNNLFIIMDNASIHKTPEVLKIIREYGHTLLFLPPYSPFLDPIQLKSVGQKLRARYIKHLLERMKSLLTGLKKQPKQLNQNTVAVGFFIRKNISLTV